MIRSLLILSALLIGMAASAATMKPTIILVHGAFADGSSWSKVIPMLQSKGYDVVAVQNPLTSLADDAAATKRAILNAPGDVVLVGHSWGGMVITQAGDDPKVKALVYVAAFAPDMGQAIGDLGKTFAPSPGLVGLQPDVSGFFSLAKDSVMTNFAQDLPAAQTSVMFATQGPIEASAFADKATVAAWKGRQNFYIVAKQDRMINPDLERQFAQALNATTTELNSSHVPMLSQPRRVAKVILQAAVAAENEQPMPQPTPAPTPEPTPAPTPEPMPTPTPTPAPQS